MYRKIFRPVLFLLDPETAHRFVSTAIKLIYFIPLINFIFRKAFSSVRVRPVEFAGLHFKGRVGLAAGFDKNADYFRAFGMFGFSFIEIGTVTPLAQTGNKKPRLFRIPTDQAMINRMGFNNKGVDYACMQLRKNKKDIIIGGNIGKNTVTPNDLAHLDYALCFEKLYDLVDYFTVNISCPNITGMEKLQDQESIRKILKEIMKIRNQKPVLKPVFLKISPDLTFSRIDDIIAVYREMKLDGLIATNTTTTRKGLTITEDKIASIGNGGLSGKPLKDKVKEIIVYICKQSNNEIPVIASGGIMSEKDALEMIESGAKLVQVYTGFIYAGPLIVKRIERLIRTSGF